MSLKDTANFKLSDRDKGRQELKKRHFEGYFADSEDEFYKLKECVVENEIIEGEAGSKYKFTDYGAPSSIRYRPEYFRGQSYDYLKAKLEQNNEKFLDSEFPPCDSSIFYKNSNRTEKSLITWIRASNLVPDPKFMVEGATRFDINQGNLGDCWFLAAVGNLTLRKKSFNHVVPKYQSFKNGIFKFNIWQFGKWVEVVVDDYLPTYKGNLIFLRSDDRNEFWSSLLEKAYAKVNGCYQSLSGGLINEAMVDFTGGCAEHYDLNSKSSDHKSDYIFDIMKKGNKRASMMGAGIIADPWQYEAELDNGLVRGHAYSITGIETVPFKSPAQEGYVALIRIRNPWGNEVEWNGRWSDNSNYWNYVSKKVKEELELKKDKDGEFYMYISDFMKNFDFLEICNLTASSLADDEKNGKLEWHHRDYHGSWVKDVSAGGSPNNYNLFATNPQFRLELKDSDKDSNNTASILVSLMQKDGRKKRTAVNDGHFYIGFVIYELSESEDIPLNGLELSRKIPAASSPYYIDLRDVTKRFELTVGTYVIIPSTYKAGEEAEFLLRIFSESNNQMTVYDPNLYKN